MYLVFFNILEVFVLQQFELTSLRHGLVVRCYEMQTERYFFVLKKLLKNITMLRAEK